MRFVTFRRSGAAPEPGVLAGNRVIGLGGAGYTSLLDVIGNWETAKSAIQSYVAGAPQEAVLTLASVSRIDSRFSWMR